MLLHELSEIVAARGIKACGLVQTNSECEHGGKCDMDVQVLPKGRVIRISQSLGREARGCRLDSQALEEAVGLVAAELENGADLMIINKFGKAEAEGRGLRPVIAEALGKGVPVVVGLNAANEAAFDEFSGGMAEKLEPEISVLVDWVGAPG